MFPLRDHTILLAVAGSRAYGLHGPDSDVDLKGVAIPPSAWFHGFSQGFEQADKPEQLAGFFADLLPEEQEAAGRSKLEGSVYELRKLFRLAASANPNIMDILFCREQELRICTPLGERLRADRGLFLSARCAHSYGGYATQQLQRIRLHHRWHTQGPQRPPARADYDLPEATLLPKDQLQAVFARVQKQVDSWALDLSSLEPTQKIALLGKVSQTLAEQQLGSEQARWTAAARWVGLSEDLIQVMQRERSWRSAREEWKRYRSWLKHRNPERAALEARFGYDTKHAAHLVRLLRMAREILETGQVHVWRGDRDAEELRQIKAGVWSYEQLLDWSAQQQQALKTAARSTALRPAPPIEELQALCIALVEASLET